MGTNLLNESVYERVWMAILATSTAITIYQRVMSIYFNMTLGQKLRKWYTTVIYFDMCVLSPVAE